MADYSIMLLSFALFLPFIRCDFKLLNSESGARQKISNNIGADMICGNVSMETFSMSEFCCYHGTCELLNDIIHCTNGTILDQSKSCNKTCMNIHHLPCPASEDCFNFGIICNGQKPKCQGKC